MVCLVSGYGIASLLKECPDSQNYIDFLENCRLYTARYGWKINQVRTDVGTKENSNLLDIYI
jgi:hypothetical protein